MANNLKALRLMLGLTQEQAASAMQTTRNQYVKLEGGSRRLSDVWISRAAEAFRVDPGQIVSEERADAINYRAKVVGRIGAGAQIEPDFEQAPEEGLFEIEADIPLPPGMIGFEVVGNSMWPRYDEGDVIICSSEGVAPATIIPMEEAAVRTSDGRRFLKRVLPTATAFDLESHNAPTIRGVQIDWASEVYTIVRAKRWRRLNGSHKQTTPPAKSRR